MVVEKISDHYAYTCKCGSVNFNLLKSGKIECAACSLKIKHKWHTPVEKNYKIPFCNGAASCFSCRFFVKDDSFCQAFNSSTDSKKYCKYHQAKETALNERC